MCRDTLNKSGFRRKKAWIHGLFSAKTTLNQCFHRYRHKNRHAPQNGACRVGAPGGIRTCDLPVRSRALYPLSYKRVSSRELPMTLLLYHIRNHLSSVFPKKVLNGQKNHPRFYTCGFALKAILQGYMLHRIFHIRRLPPARLTRCCPRGTPIEGRFRSGSDDVPPERRCVWRSPSGARF